MASCHHLQHAVMCMKCNNTPAQSLSLALDYNHGPAGAVFMAGERYADEVRVIDIPGVSMELCGGTHVSSTSQIGLFKVQGQA